MMIPYGDFTYFLVLAIFIAPAIVLGCLGKSSKRYILIVSLIFVYIIFFNQYEQLIAIAGYTVWQWLLISVYCRSRQTYNKTWLYQVSLFLSIAPLLVVKVVPIFHLQTVIGFLGISYLTFKCAQLIIEIRDGLIKQVKLFDFLAFLLFFPTLSSGPIDRYRRFVSDYQAKLPAEVYREYLYKGVNKIFQGFLYKFIIAYWIETYWLHFNLMKARGFYAVLLQSYNQFFHVFLTLPQMKSIVNTLSYMYAYSFYLFFDFAGYSAFAIGVSYMLGIQTPANFNKPFISRNIKDFWNRWHMSLSFWFRDYVYMRVVMAITRKKILKHKFLISYIGYLALFGLMGIWHGLELHFIAYGLYHAILFIGFDVLDRKNKQFKFWPNNGFMHVISIVITFHFVCFGFLIFSGRLF